MKANYLLIPLLAWATLSITTAQNRPARSTGAVLDLGIRLQNSVNLYAENGITAQYTHPKLASKRLYIGLSYVTSRLGTALNSNAIKQDNFLASASYYFRPNWLVRPVARVNVGYFAADYGSSLFDVLPKTSLLASPEFGLCYCPNFPLKINASIGYNVITGDGLTGPGTLYPVFIQTSVTWNILKSAKN
ncbi:hypothetical protein [Spirosoma utsteinense]|uniref:Outer membrane protein beta-barrel domain-containing protein n=1 Tax=Spirosoma utsteinense TaxID=2585773 RepID=A0ABR6W794_9BACT|nr:hypothetical protein [Spirosoma utsteinense]MBC3786172.1 hypothetical protein [Spirosoma utsteinense]MBC3792362.1 hypothetical protein [Spirosoma utsteinense]